MAIVLAIAIWREYLPMRSDRNLKRNEPNPASSKCHFKKIREEPAKLANSKSWKIGWGGRIRTFTIHINSVVSYRLDHAPAGFAADLRP